MDAAGRMPRNRGEPRLSLARLSLAIIIFTGYFQLLRSIRLLVSDDATYAHASASVPRI